MANPSTSAESAASCRAAKMTCLCSPTNHPGSFRCSRHRSHSPRARQLPSSSSVRASQQQAVAPGATGSKSGAGSCRTTSKAARPVLRAHLQRLLASPPPSSGGRCREFKPRLSRLGRLAVNA